MSIEKSIGWTDKTVNPIKGMCKGGCWYCWTKPLYKRKFLQPELSLNLDVFFKLPKSPKKIFLCSTHDLFGDWIPSWWRTAIFERIEANPQHTFQILTKFPQNIDRPMPDNVWLGTTVTNQAELSRITHIELIEAKRRFVSFEPLLGYINWEGFRLEFSSLDWIIVGQLTGHGKKYEPKKYWINQIKFYARYYGIPLFMKNNLKEIFGEPLIQEFP